jgi:hypothetical protein
MTNTEDTNIPAALDAAKAKLAEQLSQIDLGPIGIFEGLAQGSGPAFDAAKATVESHLAGVIPAPSTEEADAVTEQLPVVEFVDTATDFDAEWVEVSQAFRFLNWVASDEVRGAYSVNLPGFSLARQRGVRDLVNHGLVTERRWVGGEHDGRVTLKLTELGEMRLAQAREAASLLVIG